MNSYLSLELWYEIEKQYSSKKRYYHSLTHLENVLNQLEEVKDKIQDWDSVLFSIYYHDIVYDVLKSDNEEKSAELAENKMSQIHVPIERITKCKNQILSTKSHTFSDENDTNFFTDADLSILGMNWELYSEYCQNVRKEYYIYPDILYNPGRKKVLNSFLSLDKIFKTDYFHTKYENTARKNLEKELALL